MINIFKKRLKRYQHLYTHLQRLYTFFTVMPAVLFGRRGGLDHLLCTWSLVRRSAVVMGRPVNITIEPTNICNLHCPVCETGNGKLGRASRHLTLAEFRNIIEKISASTNTLLFYFMGEPFLNPEAYDMIRVAKEAGIPWVTTCTNGESVDPEKLVISGLDEVSFQIGGMSQETHQVYRVKGSLQIAMDNLKKTVQLKRKHRAGLRIVCGMILMRHNEHELSLFTKVMKDIGVDEAVIVAPSVRSMEQGAAYLPKDEAHWYYDPDAFHAGELRPRSRARNICRWIYYSMVINSSGNVVPCCRDSKGEYVMGNILSQSLEEIWNGEKYRAFRRELFSNQAQMDICSLCSGYPASTLK